MTTLQFRWSSVIQHDILQLQVETAANSSLALQGKSAMNFTQRRKIYNIESVLHLRVLLYRLIQ